VGNKFSAIFRSPFQFSYVYKQHFNSLSKHRPLQRVFAIQCHTRRSRNTVFSSINETRKFERNLFGAYRIHFTFYLLESCEYMTVLTLFLLQSLLLQIAVVNFRFLVPCILFQICIGIYNEMQLYNLDMYKCPT
jgi:hypothetical protein